MSGFDRQINADGETAADRVQRDAGKIADDLSATVDYLDLIADVLIQTIRKDGLFYVADTLNGRLAEIRRSRTF